MGHCIVHLCLNYYAESKWFVGVGNIHRVIFNGSWNDIFHNHFEILLFCHRLSFGFPCPYRMVNRVALCLNPFDKGSTSNLSIKNYFARFFFAALQHHIRTSPLFSSSYFYMFAWKILFPFSFCGK